MLSDLPSHIRCGLFFFSVALITVACSTSYPVNNGPSPTVPGTSTLTPISSTPTFTLVPPTPTFTPVPSIQTTNMNQPAAISLSNPSLNIIMNAPDFKNPQDQASSGITCGFVQSQNNRDNIIIANTGTRDKGTFDAIQQYFMNPDNLSIPIPPLQHLLGAVNTDPQNSQGCAGEMTVTNTGNTSVEIDALNLRYDADSTKNNATYNLLNVCGQEVNTNGVPFECHSGPGTGKDCAVSSTLLDGGAGQNLSSSIKCDDGSGNITPLILAPGNIKTIRLSFSSSDSSQVYKVSLSFLIAINSGHTSVALPSSFTSYLAYALSSQFQCWTPDFTNLQFIPYSGQSKFADCV